MMRFLRNAIVRVADRLRDEEPRLPIAHGSGKPSECMFCSSTPGFQVTDPNVEKSAFLCGEHVGPFIDTWTLAHELLVVRL